MTSRGRPSARRRSRLLSRDALSSAPGRCRCARTCQLKVASPSAFALPRRRPVGAHGRRAHDRAKCHISTDASANGRVHGSARGLCVIGLNEAGAENLLGWLAARATWSRAAELPGPWASTQAEAVAMAWGALVAP